MVLSRQEPFLGLFNNIIEEKLESNQEENKKLILKLKRMFWQQFYKNNKFLKAIAIKKYNSIADYNYANRNVIMRQCNIFCARALWITRVCEEDLDELQSIRSMLFPFIDQILNKLNLNNNCNSNSYHSFNTSSSTSNSNHVSDTDSTLFNNNLLHAKDSTTAKEEPYHENETEKLIKIVSNNENLFKCNSNSIQF